MTWFSSLLSAYLVISMQVGLLLYLLAGCLFAFWRDSCFADCVVTAEVLYFADCVLSIYNTCEVLYCLLIVYFLMTARVGVLLFFLFKQILFEMHE